MKNFTTYPLELLISVERNLLKVLNASITSSILPDPCIGEDRLQDVWSLVIFKLGGSFNEEQKMFYFGVCRSAYLDRIGKCIFRFQKSP